MRVAVATAKLGQWSVDLRTLEVTCSEGCKRNYGRPLDEPFTYAQLWEVVHPGDRERVQAAVHDAIQQRGDYDVEYRASGRTAACTGSWSAAARATTRRARPWR